MRARNIKPGFWRNEELVEITPTARLLFIGLWCMADRKGLLEDRPKKIKLEVFPYDDLNIKSLLDELCKHTLIFRYSANGKRYVSIPNFTKHQHPHPNEKLSNIPPPAKPDKTGTSHQGTTKDIPRTRHYRLNPDTLNPDTRNPDTRNPDILNPLDSELRSSSTAIKGLKTPPDCPQKKIIDLYHSILPKMPKVRIWNDDRKAWLRARWKEDKVRQSLDWWKKFFYWICESDWLMGRTKEEFQCDFEWLIRKTNFSKIANGRYHRAKKGQYSTIDEWLKTKTEKWEAEHEGKR